MGNVCVVILVLSISVVTPCGVVTVIVSEGSVCQASGTRWFKYDREYLCVNKSQFVPVILEPPCITCQNSDLETIYI
jgi:hypothetical protein